MNSPSPIWLYAHEPRLGLHLLLVSCAGGANLWLRRGGPGAKRPFDIPAGAPRWTQSHYIPAGREKSVAGLAIIVGSDGQLQLFGSRGSDRAGSQLMVEVSCGVGQPPHLAERWL